MSSRLKFNSHSAIFALVLGFGSLTQAQMTCFYELTFQNRARILMGTSRLHAEAFHTDYSEENALRILQGLIEEGDCRLPAPGQCVLSIDMYGHVQVSIGDDGLKTVLIGRYGEEENGRVAIYRFQQAGLCKGLKVKKAPQISAY